MEKQHINAFINGGSKEITQLYNSYRGMFMSFGKKYGLNDDDLSDIYQEAFIALRKNAISGKLDTVKSTLKTYLFGIGKYMIYDRLKEKKHIVSYESTIHIVHDEIETISIETEEEELSLEQRLLHTYFKKLGKKCQLLLTLFYSRGLTNDEIVTCTGYSDSSVVRSQKSRCIKTLREMIKS